MHVLTLCIYVLCIYILLLYVIYLIYKFYIYIYNLFYIYIYNLIEIIQNLQICYLKLHLVSNDFQAILKLPHNLITLILDKVWHVVIATNCHFKFY